MRGSTLRVAACRLLTLIGLPPDRGHLAAGVRGGHGKDGQSGVPGDGLGESGCRAAADRDEYADPYVARRFDGPGGNLDGHMLHHLWDPPSKIIAELCASPLLRRQLHGDRR